MWPIGDAGLLSEQPPEAFAQALERQTRDVAFGDIASLSHKGELLEMHMRSTAARLHHTCSIRFSSRRNSRTRHRLWTVDQHCGDFVLGVQLAYQSRPVQ
jgi:hypothetical protein